ncbi:hypothetical protein L7F22_012738 [Adiantum nelumboides]|nr:hypothetical protein [Adiantum nelumboides]
MSKAAALTTRACEIEADPSPPQVLPALPKAGPSPPQVIRALPEYVGNGVCPLKKGLVIAVPTDTFYGFATDACCEDAINKIYLIKGGNNMNPLVVCLAHPDDFEKYNVTKHPLEGLLKEMFPSPVIAVLSRGEQSLLSKCLNLGLCSIGIRIPDSAFIKQVVEAFGGAIALTSANVSGQSSTIRIQEFESLWSNCAIVFLLQDVLSMVLQSKHLNFLNKCDRGFFGKLCHLCL